MMLRYNSRNTASFRFRNGFSSNSFFNSAFSIFATNLLRIKSIIIIPANHQNRKGRRENCSFHLDRRSERGAHETQKARRSIRSRIGLRASFIFMRKRGRDISLCHRYAEILKKVSITQQQKMNSETGMCLLFSRLCSQNFGAFSPYERCTYPDSKQTFFVTWE